MKKIIFLVLFISFFTLCKAQYTDILDFKGTNSPQGLNPYGNLTLSVTGDTLFGMTAYGGAYSAGNIFCMSSGGYTDLYDFSGVDGLYPYGSLILSNDTLYGMTAYGGALGNGCIFAMTENASWFSDIYDFSGYSGGSSPYGSLLVRNDTLWGTTSTGGGTSSYGNVFCIETNGSGYYDVLDFNGSDGAFPYSSLTESHGYLWGTCSEGGNSGYGDIFVIDPHTLAYSDLFDFDGTNGAYCFGSLIPSVTGDSLFGMTSQGNGYGNVFAYVVGTGFENLFDFSSSNGANPNGDLTVSRGMLYGMTSLGGAYNDGILFSLRINSGLYTDLNDFNGFNGSYPYSSVTFSHNHTKFFGMTTQGNKINDGLIFSYNTLIIDSFRVTNVTCTNGYRGDVSAYVSGGATPYTYLWNPGGATTQSLSGLSAGSYTVTVTDNIGSMDTSVVVISDIILPVSELINVSCYGGDDGVIQVSPSGGTAPYVYSWKGPLPIATGTVTISMAPGPIERGLSAGTYTITVKDSCGDSAFVVATISQPALLIVSDSIVANVHCSGASTGSIATLVWGGTSPYIYQWSDASSQTTAIATGLSAGTYYITVTDTNGCTAVDSAIISQPSKPPVGVTIARAKNVSCSGSFDGMALALASGGVPPYTYYWSPGSDTTSIVTGLSAGIYTVQTTDSRGCNAVTSANISQPSVLRVSDTTIASLTLAYPAGGTPPYTFSWTPGGSTSSFISGISAGTYTVVVTDANACVDSAIVFLTPPSLEIYIPPNSNPSVHCFPGQGYVTFPIMAIQDTLQRFNSCVLDLQLGEQFIGDSAANGGVVVVPGAQFQPAPGNDYNILNVSNLSDSVIQIQFGSPADSSPNGTFIPVSDTMTLFTIKLNYQDCNITPVGITNDSATTFLSYYTAIDSNIASIDLDTISSNWVCSNCALYPCSSSDGTLDSLCCCADSFTYVTSYDTLYNYFYHSVQYGNTGYAGVETFNLSSRCAPVISYSTPVINAGTNSESVPPNSSILSITGYNFGRRKGYIEVSDANRDSTLTLDSSDILRWTDTLIKVKMPSYIFNNNLTTPGSGPFRVYDACGYYDYGNLQINYNIKNAGAGTEKLRSNIVMEYPSESFNFVCDTSVSHNKMAFACVKKAIQTWNCYTGVNWKVSNDTNVAIDTTLTDGVSAIYFSYGNANFPNSSTLMETQQQLLPDCPTSYADSMIFYDEADIKIRLSRNISSGREWSYDTTYTITSDSFNYFYDNILHELGHAHGLNHINDLSSLMNYYIPIGQRDSITSGSTYPGPATLIGAFDMINTSLAHSPTALGCSSYNILVLDSVRCKDHTVNISGIVENSYSLNLYPNPINIGNLTIEYQITTDSYIQFKIVNCIGEQVILLQDEHKMPGIYNEQVNINALAKGIYIFIANINGNVQTIKFIKI